MVRSLLSGALVCALFAATASAMSYKLPSSDQIQQNAKTAAAVAQIFACDISTVANIALTAEQAVNSGGQVVRTGTTTKIVGVSTALCGVLGGVVSIIVPSAAPASK
ncbi:hypothetical protein SAMN06265338_101713 [Rhodoblastus acidophilus]|uniref:Uncharacterized protein n=1 Tax=Rhodoblastus acidophilus TaxID=1074 RepID=A0A212QKV7_RHOAC|nr:hypothetical protein [Rhodoblastus acidophilus]PPQ39884.1 hypothetical protein CKO16_03515 [Rhodoblastus acidophilus]RAI17092.1 hypothetical protein CH337_18060 [Rhodoblastus acidophilus]SNB59994.1 hypothetical protein SAMN06265338_101713 [Rhodoblastus acidophilus]